MINKINKLFSNTSSFGQQKPFKSQGQLEKKNAVIAEPADVGTFPSARTSAAQWSASSGRLYTEPALQVLINDESSQANDCNKSYHLHHTYNYTHQMWFHIIHQEIMTHHRNHAHPVGFVVVELWMIIITHIIQGCFTGTGAIHCPSASEATLNDMG